MKNNPLFIKCSVLFFFITFLSCQKESRQVININKINPDKLPYNFKTIASISNIKGQSFEPIDINMDGKSEIIQIDNLGLDDNNPSFIQILETPFDKIIVRNDFRGKISLSGVTDYDQDKNQEIFVSEQINDTVYIHMFAVQGRNVINQYRFIGAVKSETKNVIQKWPWNCALEVQGLLDINNDNFLDILFRIDTGEAYQPRGFLAYDIHNKKEIWRKITGYRPIFLHITKNRKNEDLIISGSTSPGNAEGKLLNGTDDHSTYFTILRKDNTNCYRKEIGGNTTIVRPYIQDLNGDGTKEIFFSFSTFGNQKLANYIRFFDLNRMKMTSRQYARECRLECNIEFIDGDRDGNTDIVMGWEDGTIEIRDYSLNRIQSIVFPNFQPDRLAIEDLDKDGTKEILCSGFYKGEAYILLLSAALELEGLISGSRFLGGHYIYKTKFGGEKWIKILKKNSLNFVKLELNNPIWVSLNQFGFFHGFITMLIISVIFSITIYKIHKKKKRSQLLKTIVDTNQIPSILVDESNLVQAFNVHFRKLTNLSEQNITGNHWEYLLADQKWTVIRKWLKKAINEPHQEQHKEFFMVFDDQQRDILVRVHDNPLSLKKENLKLITFQDITDIAQSKRAVAWASMSQRLAHEIKTPLSTVMLTAQRLQMEVKVHKNQSDETEKYIKRILNQVYRLQKMTDAFLKFCRIEKPQFERIDINKLIQETLNENLSRIGNKVTVETSLPKNLPHISIDTNQITIVLQNLIDNSLNAMAGKGILNITTRLVQWLHSIKTNNYKEAIQIEVSDTGKGMTPEELNKLFKPFFSNFPGGTGLGSVIIKKIIEDHHGEIKYKSEPNIGTTVLVTLPVNHH